MSRRIFLTSDAETDFESISYWYDHQDSNLSARFQTELYATLLRIARYPFAYGRAGNFARRALMNRFRYYIYYRFDSRRVLVLAIIHQRRADTAWLNRQDQIHKVTDD